MKFGSIPSTQPYLDPCLGMSRTFGADLRRPECTTGVPLRRQIDGGFDLASGRVTLSRNWTWKACFSFSFLALRQNMWKLAHVKFRQVSVLSHRGLPGKVAKWLGPYQFASTHRKRSNGNNLTASARTTGSFDHVGWCRIHLGISRGV